jgi:hypothetical protein
MGGVTTRRIETGTDTCFLGQNAGKQYIDSAAFDASSLSAGGGGIDAIQTVTLTGSPAGGTFTLTYDGGTTSAIAYNAAVAAVQTALEALAGIGDGDVHVTGSTGGPYAVHFINDLGHKAAKPITASGAGLTGGTAPAVTVGQTTVGTEDGYDPRILVGSASFPGTIVKKVAGTGGAPDKVREYDGSGTIFGIIDGVEEFITNGPSGDRDVAVYNAAGLVVDALKVHNYTTYKSAIDAWAATRAITIKHGS